MLGWTNQLPELLRTHHLVISQGRHGGPRSDRGALPDHRQPRHPGQEEANAKLVKKSRIGAVVEKNREAAEMVEQAFDKRAELWNEWRAT